MSPEQTRRVPGHYLTNQNEECWLPSYFSIDRNKNVCPLSLGCKNQFLSHCYVLKTSPHFSLQVCIYNGYILLADLFATTG